MFKYRLKIHLDEDDGTFTSCLSSSKSLFRKMIKEIDTTVFGCHPDLIFFTLVGNNILNFKSINDSSSLNEVYFYDIT
jgi:hypothetical protein